MGAGLMLVGLLVAGSQLLLARVFDQDLVDRRSYLGLTFPMALMTAALGAVLLVVAVVSG